MAAHNRRMFSDPTALYAALLAHDPRFDGRFYVGVTSTGIYCRPVCRVRAPKAIHCRFFEHPAAAEAAGFGPCLRCRPELAPGHAAIDGSARLAWAAAQRIDAGQLDEHGLGGLADRLGISDRHLRRVFSAAFGVTPVAYAQTQRLLLAKRLLTDTALPVTDVALAAGFGSLRRFNALFQSRYRMAPGDLRRQAPRLAATDGVHCELAYRPPFDWPRLLAFFAARCVAGVEEVSDGVYRRSLGVQAKGERHAGWLSLTLAEGRDALAVTVAPGLVRVLPAVLNGVRRLCDLDCEPERVAQILGPLAADAPGLRVPGSCDGFEIAVRAILGQQVTVLAARTLAGRLAAALGDPVATPFPALERLFPSAERLLAAGSEAIGALGVTRQRALAITALAEAVASGRLDLGPAADVEQTLARLQALPGVGRWTAEYIALRALAWPDAWPSGDRALCRALAVDHARQADVAAGAWRPWRGYATMHLWRRLAETSADQGVRS